MATQFTPASPFTLFSPTGPLGFFPNNFAANAGDLPNILWVSSLQTPLLNSFSPVFPPLVTNIFGGGPLPLGSGFRPAPLGATPTGGTLLPIPGTNSPGAGTNGLTGPTSTNTTGSTVGGQISASFGNGNLTSTGGLGNMGNDQFLQQLLGMSFMA